MPNATPSGDGGCPTRVSASLLGYVASTLAYVFNSDVHRPVDRRGHRSMSVRRAEAARCLMLPR